MSDNAWGKEPLGLVKGNYVLATKWGDGDPQDEFCIGFFDRYERPTSLSGRYFVLDDKGSQFRANGFRRCEKKK